MGLGDEVVCLYCAQIVPLTSNEESWQRHKPDCEWVKMEMAKLQGAYQQILTEKRKCRPRPLKNNEINKKAIMTAIFLIYRHGDTSTLVIGGKYHLGDNATFYLQPEVAEEFNSPEMSDVRKEIMTLKNGLAGVHCGEFIDRYHNVSVLAATGKEIALPGNTDLDKLKFDVFIKTLYFKFGLRIREKIGDSN